MNWLGWMCWASASRSATPGARDNRAGQSRREHVPDEIQVIGRDPEPRGRERISLGEAALVDGTAA